MKIACLQFAPKVGEIAQNLNRADAVLINSQSQLDGIDLLVLPELAFSGYNFKSLADISPYLEKTGSGISALWAETAALKLNCNVIVGYPEKVDIAETWPASPEYYNSALMVSADGELLANYRKSFLYAVDEKWALEGQDGFFGARIPGFGNVAMGICMDINPYRFEAPWNAFEFAFHVLEVNANLVILTMAWLTRENPSTFAQEAHEPDMNTLEYWIQRLEPIIRTDSDEEIIVIFCNRTGTEGNATYAGTSTVIGVKNGEVNLYGILGRGVDELLVVDTSQHPMAKLVTDDAEPFTAEKASQAHRSPELPSRVPTYSYHNRNSTPSAPAPSFHGTHKEHNGSTSTSSMNHPMHDVGETWEFMFDAASLASMPSLTSLTDDSEPKARGGPKLGLQIPVDTHLPADSKNTSGGAGNNYTQRVRKQIDVPTPTAPSPTPTTMRPYAEFHGESTPRTSSRTNPRAAGVSTQRTAASTSSKNKLAVPPSVNVKSGASVVKVKQIAAPATLPSRLAAGETVRRQTSISEAPPSPPIDSRAELDTSPMNYLDKLKQVRQNIDAVEQSAEAGRTFQPSRGTGGPAGAEGNDRGDGESRKQTKKSQILQLIESFSFDSEEEPLDSYDLPRMIENAQQQHLGSSGPAGPTGLGLSYKSTHDIAPVRPSSTKAKVRSVSRPQTATGYHHTTRQSLSHSQSFQNFHNVHTQSNFQSQPEPAIFFRPQTDSSAPIPAQPGTPSNQKTHKSRSKSRGSTPRGNTPRNSTPVRQPYQPRQGDSGRGSLAGSSAQSRIQTAPESWMNDSPSLTLMPRQPVAPADDIVAVINLVNGNCPMHSGSTPVQGRSRSQSHGHGQGRSRSQGQNQNSNHNHETPQRAPSAQYQAGRQSTPHDDSVYEVLLAPHLRDIVDSYTNRGRRTSSPRNVSDSHSHSRTRQTPKFNPPTPRAMEFKKGDESEASGKPLIQVK